MQVLWGNVAKGAFERVCLGVMVGAAMHMGQHLGRPSQSQVTNAGAVDLIQQDVGRFDIPVQDGRARLLRMGVLSSGRAGMRNSLNISRIAGKVQGPEISYALGWLFVHTCSLQYASARYTGLLSTLQKQPTELFMHALQQSKSPNKLV